MGLFSKIAGVFRKTEQEAVLIDTTVPCEPSPQIPSVGFLDNEDDLNFLFGVNDRTSDQVLSKLIAKNPILSNAVLTIRTSVAGLKLTTEAKEGVEQKFWLNSLRNPWKGASLSTLLSDYTWRQLSKGEVLIKVTKLNTQAVFQLLDHEWITFRSKETGVPLYAKHNSGEILDFKTWPEPIETSKPFAIRIALGDMGSKKHAPLQAALMSAAVFEMLYHQAAAVLSNRPMVSGFLSTESKVSDKNITRVETILSRYRTGQAKAGGVLFLSDVKDAKYQPFSQTVEKLISPETRRDAASDVAISLGLPIELITGQTTFNNLNTARTILYEKTSLPLYGDPFISAVSAAVLPPGEGLMIDREQIDAFRLARLDGMSKMAKVDFLTEDEKRAIFGYGAKKNAS